MRTGVLLMPAFVVLACGSVMAQSESQSERAAQEIAQVMKERKLDCLATAEPGAPDRFVAMMYFPTQLLIVSARYTAPSLLRERVLARDYRAVYEQLQGGAERDGKLFVQDLGADGLHVRPAPAGPMDVVYQSVNVRTAFNGDWKAQGLTEQQYHERFRAVDEHYARLLQALLAQAKGDTPPR